MSLIGSLRHASVLTYAQLYDAVRVEWQLESATSQQGNVHELSVLSVSLTAGSDDFDQFSLPASESLHACCFWRTRIPRFHPKWYSSCPNLLQLTLRTAGLTSLPTLPPQLRQLDVQNNHIQFINGGSALQSLQSIDIRGNLIKDMNALRGLSSAKQLQQLVLHPNPITVGSSQTAKKLYRRFHNNRLAGGDPLDEEASTANCPAWRRVKAVIRNVVPAIRRLDGIAIGSHITESNATLLSQPSIAPGRAAGTPSRTVSAQSSSPLVPRVAVDAARRVQQERERREQEEIEHRVKVAQAERKAALNRQAVLQMAFAPDRASPAVVQQITTANRLAQPTPRHSEQELFDLECNSNRNTQNSPSRPDLLAMKVDQRPSLQASRIPQRRSERSMADTSSSLSRGAWLLRRTVPTSMGVSLVPTPHSPSRVDDREAAAHSLANATCASSMRIRRLQELSTPKQRTSKYSASHSTPKVKRLPRRQPTPPAVQIQKWMNAAHGVLQNAGAIGAMVQELLNARLDADAFIQMIAVVGEEALELKLVQPRSDKPGHFEPHVSLARVTSTPILDKVDTSTASVAVRTATLVEAALGAVSALCASPTAAHAEAHLDSLARVAPIGSQSNSTESPTLALSSNGGGHADQDRCTPAPDAPLSAAAAAEHETPPAALAWQDDKTLVSSVTPLPLEPAGVKALGSFSPAASSNDLLAAAAPVDAGSGSPQAALVASSPLARSTQPPQAQLQPLKASPTQPPPVPVSAFSRTGAAAKLDG